MNVARFIASRLHADPSQKHNASRPAVLIATAGIALGLAVMVISVAVVIGFKSEIREKVAGFGAEIQIGNLHSGNRYESIPVTANDTLLSLLKEDRDVAHAQRFSLKAGMIKTDNAFQGIMLKGVGAGYDTTFFARQLVAGCLPAFNDTASTGQVAVSQALCNKLRLKLGDKLYTYFIQDEVRARRLTICGIYQTNFSELDNLFLLTDRFTVNRLNRWEAEQVSGIEVKLLPDASLEDATYRLSALIGNTTDRHGQQYCVQNIEMLYPQLFAWLDVLDINIWVILALMMGVAGFTMISGLLILIIERTQMIGVLKALGADNWTVRRTFLWLSLFLIGRGMLIGNAIAIVFYLVQSHWGVLQLDPDTYYMDTVPVLLPPIHLLLLNAGAMLTSVLMLVGPSYLVTKIRPSQAIRYE